MSNIDRISAAARRKRPEFHELQLKSRFDRDLVVILYIIILENSSCTSTPAVSKIRVSRENSTMSTVSTPLVDHTHKLVEVSINHSGGHPMKRKVLR